MRAVLHAEWTKQRSMASTWWSLIATIAAITGGGAAMTALVHAGTGNGLARLAMSGALLGQAVVAVLGASAIGDEYGNGLILISLTAVPRRGILLAAKAIVLAGTVMAAATIAASASLVGAALIRPDGPDPRLSTAIRAILATAVYLVLIALLALGTAAASGSTATATALTLGLLYLPPLLAALIADPVWRLRVQRLAPASTSLGVAAVWAAMALVTGCRSLRRRDV